MKEKIINDDFARHVYQLRRKGYSERAIMIILHKETKRTISRATIQRAFARMNKKNPECFSSLHQD